MKANHVEIDGKTISYLDKGEGKPIVLVHCSSACYREWLLLIKSLPRSFRVLAPDLWGYGKSEVFSQGETFDENIDVKIVSAMLDLCDEPAHIVGHSYGGALAVEAARLNQAKVESLTLIEPSCFHLLQKSPDCASEWNTVQEVAFDVIQSLDAGDFRRSMDTYMSFFMGDQEWANTDENTKMKLSASIAKVAGEFTSIGTRSMELNDYGKIQRPVTMVQGGKTRNTAKKIIELLSGAISGSRVIEIPDAGHMSPMTHARQVVDIVLSSLVVDMPKAA